MVESCIGVLNGKISCCGVEREEGGEGVGRRHPMIFNNNLSSKLIFSGISF